MLRSILTGALMFTGVISAQLATTQAVRAWDVSSTQLSMQQTTINGGGGACVITADIESGSSDEGGIVGRIRLGATSFASIMTLNETSMLGHAVVNPVTAEFVGSVCGLTDISNFVLTVAPAAAGDFSTAESSSISFEGTETNGQRFSYSASITGDADGPAVASSTSTIIPNTAPSITSNGEGTVSVAENQTAVTTVTAIDAEDDATTPPTALQFALTGGADQGLFSISDTGVLTFNEAPDFEANSSDAGNNDFQVQVTVTDSGIPGLFVVTGSGPTAPAGLTAEQNITVSVTDVDEIAPTVTITDVPETSNAAFTATFTFSEAVTGFTLADITVGNDDASAFTGVDGDTVYTALITPSGVLLLRRLGYICSGVDKI